MKFLLHGLAIIARAAIVVALLMLFPVLIYCLGILLGEGS